MPRNPVEWTLHERTGPSLKMYTQISIRLCIVNTIATDTVRPGPRIRMFGYLDPGYAERTPPPRTDRARDMIDRRYADPPRVHGSRYRHTTQMSEPAWLELFEDHVVAIFQ